MFNVTKFKSLVAILAAGGGVPMTACSSGDGGDSGGAAGSGSGGEASGGGGQGGASSSTGGAAGSAQAGTSSNAGAPAGGGAGAGGVPAGGAAGAPPMGGAGGMGGSGGAGGTPGGDTCAYAFDGECDEPSGTCPPGTDTFDCACTDTGPEGNRDPSMATDLGQITDCDTDASAVDAVMANAADVDFFRFTGQDVFGCLVDPRAAVTAPGATMVDLCMYADCGPGGTTVTCTAGVAVSYDTLQGCCERDAPVQIGVQCQGTADTADVYISVTSEVAACNDYRLEFHY